VTGHRRTPPGYIDGHPLYTRLDTETLRWLRVYCAAAQLSVGLAAALLIRRGLEAEERPKPSPAVPAGSFAADLATHPDEFHAPRFTRTVAGR
jgi:hypothetical protein